MVTGINNHRETFACQTSLTTVIAMLSSQIFLDPFQLLVSHLMLHLPFALFSVLLLAIARSLFLSLPSAGPLQLFVEMIIQRKNRISSKEGKTETCSCESTLHYFCIITFVFYSGAAEKNCSNCVILCSYSGTKIWVIGFF